jgi:hypothetical protein
MYFFYLYHGKNMLHYTFANEMMLCVSYVLDQNDDLDFYYTNTLKQHIASVQQRSSTY